MKANNMIQLKNLVFVISHGIVSLFRLAFFYVYTLFRLVFFYLSLRYFAWHIFVFLPGEAKKRKKGDGTNQAPYAWDSLLSISLSLSRKNNTSTFGVIYLHFLFQVN